MTKRGHFILNGAARVIVNQILRSPGIYYQQKVYENYDDRQKSNANNQEEDPLNQNGEGSALQPVNLYKRFYCDLICMRGSWLRIEMDKEKNIWAQMKKGPKIPIYWFLLAMGLSEKVIMKSIMDPQKLLGNLEKNTSVRETRKSKLKTKRNTFEKGSESSESVKFNKFYSDLQYEGVKTKPKLSYGDFLEKNIQNPSEIPVNKTLLEDEKPSSELRDELSSSSTSSKKQNYPYLKNTPEAWQAIYTLLHSKTKTANFVSTLPTAKTKDQSVSKNGFDTSSENSTNRKNSPTLDSTGTDGTFEEKSATTRNLTELGRQWLYNRFMNPRSYDLGKQGRVSFNKKLGLTIASHQLTLTGLDVLYATDYLIKVEKGIFDTDDIDHLKNRRVRTSGELIQIQIGVGLVRLEKFIRYNENMLESKRREIMNMELSSRANSRSKFNIGSVLTDPKTIDSKKSDSNMSSTYSEKYVPVNQLPEIQRKRSFSASSLSKNIENTNESYSQMVFSKKSNNEQIKNISSSSISSIINNKAFNSAIREFFGTSPLSQFMDQINPLAELTHKRRLSSMGPGGVTRDTATLAIRGIHPTHYGRICPIETPEGKNTGLVNSMTTYAMVNSSGILESPFYKVYKGQVQKNTGMYYLNAEQEEKIKLAAADLFVSPIGFLPKAILPARIAETFTKIPRSQVQYIGVSPLQMISIAASLIPFLEHDDANRALMGSNMQRQAVPLIRHERPIVGTGLESRAVSDSGHVIQAKYSGLVTYVSAKKIVVSL